MRAVGAAMDAFGDKEVLKAVLKAKDKTERRIVRQLAKLASLVERDPS